jgi:hypothetical protein
MGLSEQRAPGSGCPAAIVQLRQRGYPNEDARPFEGEASFLRPRFSLPMNGMVTGESAYDRRCTMLHGFGKQSVTE